MELAKRSLMYFEDLSLPTVQIIVMSASMGCGRCRQRVSQLTAKMTGVREYTVDVINKQVIIKGDFGRKNTEENGYFSVVDSNREEHCCYPLKILLRSFVATCLGQHVVIP